MEQITSFFGGFRRQRPSHMPSTSSQYHEWKQQQQRSPEPPSKEHRQQTSSNSAPPYILIRWHQETIPIVLHPGRYRQYTIRDIKLQCKALLHIPLTTMTLQYNGGYLQDDQATIESLGIRPYATIIVFGEQVLSDQVQQIASGNEEEVGCLRKIQKVMEEHRPLSSRVQALESLQEKHTVDTIDRQRQQDRRDEVLYLGEILMRALISLDAVDCPSSFTTARQERRQAVRFCQGLLDRVDVLKAFYLPK